MARSSDPFRLLLASLACAALVAAPFPPGVKAAGALPLVLYLPGRCCLAAAFPDRRVDGETRVLSAALSLALVTLLGVALAQVTRLGPQVWLAALPVLCVVACLVAALGRRATHASVLTAGRAPLGVLRLLSLVAAVAAAGFAYVDASRGARSQRPDVYTDFWIVPASGQVPALATAGVKNEEGRDATYAIDVVARGSVVERQEAFRLQPRETRIIKVALPRVVFAAPGRRPVGDETDRPEEAGLRVPDGGLGAERVELRLFKDGNRDVAYRRVWIALPAPITDTVAMGEDSLPAGDLSYSGSALGSLRASLRAEPAAGPEAPSHDPAPAPPVGPVRDTTHALDMSQAAALRAPAYAADTGNLGVTLDDATASLRSRRFTPGPAAAISPTSPD